jgi:MFS family permease
VTEHDPSAPGAGAEPPTRVGLVRRLAVDITPLRVSAEYRRLWLGESVSFLGTQLTAVAVSIQVYDITRSSAAVGLVGLAAFVPLVTLGLFGGALADAVERRRLALLTSSGLALLSGLLALQAVLDLRSPLLLYLLVAAQSALFAVDSPTRRTFPPRLLPPQLIPAANALSMVTMGFGSTGGPLLAGVLVGVGGYGAAYGVDVLTFAVALLALLRLRAMPPEPSEGGPQRAGFASVVDGLRFLRGRDVLLATFAVDLIAMVFGMPRAVFPELADRVLGGGATTVGLLNGALAAGSLAAAALSGPTGRVRRQGVGVVAAVCAWGVAVAAFGLSRSLWVALLALFVAGAADAVSAVWRTAVLQLATPDEFRGRLNGVFTVVVAGGPRLGDLRVGGAAALLGTTAAVTGGGALVVLGALAVAAALPRLVAYDSADPHA